MASLDPPVTAVRAAVTRALEEDLTPLGDISAALIPPDAVAVAEPVSYTHLTLPTICSV